MDFVNKINITFTSVGMFFFQRRNIRAAKNGHDKTFDKKNSHREMAFCKKFSSRSKKSLDVKTKPDINKLLSVSGGITLRMNKLT